MSNHLVVVTGARDWPDGEGLVAMLREGLRQALEGDCENFFVLHGDCRTGADRWARDWADKSFAAQSFPMPAQWDKWGKVAGPMRNTAMAEVASNLDGCGWEVSCHAFGLKDSRGGTRDCVTKLEAHGFTVEKHEAEDARG